MLIKVRKKGQPRLRPPVVGRRIYSSGTRAPSKAQAPEFAFNVGKGRPEFTIKPGRNWKTLAMLGAVSGAPDLYEAQGWNPNKIPTTPWENSDAMTPGQNPDIIVETK